MSDARHYEEVGRMPEPKTELTKYQARLIFLGKVRVIKCLG